MPRLPSLSAACLALFGLFCAPALAAIPKVALSEQHRAMCRVGVGDELPKMALKTPNGDDQALRPLLGKKATVVVFYQAGAKQELGWMTRSLLADLPRDVAEPLGKQGVTVVAIRVGAAAAKPAKPTKGVLNLVDPAGDALATVGEGKLPRVYVVDPTGKIVWFDIEYSNSTRRELKQTLATVTEPAAVAQNVE